MLQHSLKWKSDQLAIIDFKGSLGETIKALLKLLLLEFYDRPDPMDAPEVSDALKTDALKTDALKSEALQSDALKTDALKTDSLETEAKSTLWKQKMQDE